MLTDSGRASLFACVPGRAAAAPSTTAPTPSTLPAPPTPLLGREREAEAASDILRRRETRLLTLAGPGGVGKTRLALEVVRRAAEHFPDGAAFVALAPLGDAGLVVTAISRTLGLREAGGRSPRGTLQRYLSGKEMLLVLDNFEHVMGQRPRWSGCSVLVRASACSPPAVLPCASGVSGSASCRRWRCPSPPTRRTSRA